MRVLGHGVTPIREVVLTVIQIFWWLGKHVYLLSSNLQLLHLNANEDTKYRTAKCNTDMNLVINLQNQSDNKIFIQHDHKMEYQ